MFKIISGPRAKVEMQLNELKKDHNLDVGQLIVENGIFSVLVFASKPEEKG